MWNAARLEKYHNIKELDIETSIGLTPGEATAYMKAPLNHAISPSSSAYLVIEGCLRQRPCLCIQSLDKYVLSFLLVSLDGQLRAYEKAVKAAFLVIQYDMTRAVPGWHRALIYSASGYLFLTFLLCFFMSFVYCRNDLSTLWYCLS